MSTIVAYYAVTDLYIVSEAIGLERWIERDGVRWRIQLPQSDDDPTLPHFEYVESTMHERRGIRPGHIVATQSIPGIESVEHCAITAFRLARMEPGDGINAESWLDQDTSQRVTALFHEMDQMAGNFIGLLRGNFTQYWLGFSGQLASPLGTKHVYDDDSNLMPLIHVERMKFPRPVRPATVDGISHALAWAGARSDLSGEALLDALFILNELRREDEALLYASTALEAEVKRTLRRATPDVLQPALELALKNRALEFNAKAHYTELMNTFAGRSLALDDKGLLRRLDMLIQDRNTLVHGLQRDRAASTYDHLNTAIKVRTWLLSISAASSE